MLMRPCLALFCYLPSALLLAQAPAPKPAPPAPDILVLNDGERLVGHFLRSNGSSLVFKSEMLGEVTIDWSKTRELHTSATYAVVEKKVKLGRHPSVSSVPHGSLEVANQTITVQPSGAAAVNVPVGDSAAVLEEATFQKDIVHNPGFLEGWTGAVTAGATVVQATQQSRAFNGAVNLVRAIPGETWLEPRDRTIVDFNASEGFVVQPNTPRIKTEILHADIERDEYISGRLYGFGQAIFDHNYSQGLDLQQNYGGGLGYTAIKKADLTLDFKGSASYIRQSFQNPANNHNLIGSTFAQDLLRKFPHGMILLEQVTVTPAWNEMSAWMTTGEASFNAPVYKRFSFTLGVLDNFLNDPPPGFRKNSFQATTGLTYSLK
jgi:Protein of unknown function, DUF481